MIECAACGELVHMIMEEDIDSNTVVGIYLTCPECKYVGYEDSGAYGD